MSGISDLGRPWLAFVTGRIAEPLTGRPMRPARVAIELRQGSGTRALPARLSCKDGGWYALSLPGGQDLPEPPPAEALTLVLSVSLADGRTRNIERVLSGADLARVPCNIRVGDRTLPSQAIAGAPFRLDCLFEPAPVALQGVVLADGDPLSPVAGAAVSTGALATQTDARGGFRLGPLPVTAEVAITVDHGGTATVFTHRPDFAQPLNRAEFSVSP